MPLMQHWDDLRFCLALYRHGTMSAAAMALGTNIATVSRRIDRLTQAMGETLFLKQDRAWVPTQRCHELVTIARETEQHLTTLEASKSDGPAPGATLRLTCELAILQLGFLKSLPEFLESYKDLRVDLLFRPTSLAYAETDVSVGFDEPTEGRIMRRKLGELHLQPYVHERFANTVEGWISIPYGAHERRVDIAMERHFRVPPKIWVEGLNLTATLMADVPLAVMLPAAFADQRPEIVPLPGADFDEDVPVWVSYHSSRKLDPVVRVGMKFIEDSLTVDPKLGFLQT